MFRHLPGWSHLRVRLFALLLLALVPASALLVLTHFERRRAEMQHVTDEALRLARLAAHDQERLFDEVRRVLSGLANEPEIRLPGQVCSRYLSRFLTHYPQYGNFIVANTEGDIFCGARPMGDVNIADRTYFRETLRTADFSVGDYQVGRITKRSSLVFGYPTRDAAGALNGVVAIALDLEWFNQFAAQAQLPRGGTVMVVDRNGVVLAAANDNSRIGRTVPADSPLGQQLKVQSAGEVPGLDGVRRLYGTSHFKRGDATLTVAVGLPLDDIQAANASLYRALALLAAVGVLSAVIAWVGALTFIVRPLDKLRDATKRLTSGDLSARAALASGVMQLDSLGADFDAMTEALQDRALKERDAHAAREEVEEKYRHLVEQSLVGVYLVQGPNAEVIYANPKFAEIFGYSVDEIQGMSFGMLVYKGDWPIVAAAAAKRMTGEIKSMEYSFRGQRKDGTIVNVNVHSARTVYKGHPAFMGVLKDESQQKQLEQQLLQAQKMEAIGRLAGGVAHDFNNLLTVITGYSEFLSHSLAEGSPERAHVEEIHKAADSASNLTRQLLAFSRKQMLQPEVLSINKIVSGFDKMLRRLIGEDIRVTLSLDPDLALTKVDPGQIEQVIMNLAVNGRDAMPDGGTLTIQTANITLDEEYVRMHAGAQVGPHVMMAVSDTGTGMSAETQARVFEPFFTTKERDRGTGLGLSTVYGIVKQSGGSIWLYSEIGRGTTFKLFFPIATAARVKQDATVENVRVTGGSETIVVVEDNVSLRTWIAEALGNLGYAVIPLGTPADALAMSVAKHAPVDLILTDVILPSMNGPDLVKRLAKRFPNMKVLYMSGYTDEAIAPQGILPEGEKILQKPFSATTLATRVRSALDSARTASSL